MDPSITRDIFAIDENSVTRKEGSSNGIEITSSIFSYEEVRGAKLQRTTHICKSVACCKLSKNYKIITLPL